MKPVQYTPMLMTGISASRSCRFAPTVCSPNPENPYVGIIRQNCRGSECDDFDRSINRLAPMSTPEVKKAPADGGAERGRTYILAMRRCQTPNNAATHRILESVP